MGRIWSLKNGRNNTHHLVLIEKNLNLTTKVFSNIINQLEKDFRMVGWPFPDHLKHNEFSELWLDELKIILSKGYDKEKSKLFQLLYRIDIGENELVKATDLLDNDSNKEKTFTIISELIFFRECKKVHDRMKN